MKSIEWTCELEGCNNTFTRYPYQVKNGTKKYCCQSHAGQEFYRKKGPEYFINRKIPIYNCKWCNEETKNYSEVCTICQHIQERINKNKIINFTPMDYYNLLEKQYNKCGICKINKCFTGKSFAIDHDHNTGEVRGLLCRSCNVAVGWYKNKKEALLDYLQ